MTNPAAETPAMGSGPPNDAVLTIGNYDLLEKIAEGGMGSIYRGRHRDKGTIVAIKVMPAHMASNAVLLKRFEQEFRTASRLDHPNIVRALDYGEAGDTPYLVMEFVDGESLGAKLEREGRMPEETAIRVIAQVAQGLHRAHKQNLVHRDVKPDNILVTKDGVAKLADLGLVKETDTDLNLTKTGRGLGTPHFMAPEQFRNAKNADVRCDIYSLGATLYQMVTGELPFRSSGPLDAWMKKLQNDLTPPRRLVPTLSERTDWAILRAMSAERERRPASCREFVEDLTGQSTRRPTTAPDTGLPTHDLWYLVYKDENGALHTVKGSTAAIRRSLREGMLGDASNIRAARTKSGPFEPLRGYPEFRDIVVTPAAVPVAAAAAAPAGRIAPPTVQTTIVAGNGATNGVPLADEVPEPPLLPAGGSSRVKRLTKPRPIHGAMTPKGAPKIDLDHLPPPSETAHDSLKWVVLILLAAGLSVAAYLLLLGR